MTPSTLTLGWLAAAVVTWGVASVLDDEGRWPSLAPGLVALESLLLAGARFATWP